MVGLRDDPRYDMARSFEAASAVRLPAACERIMELFGRRYGLPEFFIDCDPDGDEVSVWTESRAEAVAVYVTVQDRFLTPAEEASGVLPPVPNPYTVVLCWSSRLIGWDEERAIQTALAEAFACPLVPLPRRYFA